MNAHEQQSSESVNNGGKVLCLIGTYSLHGSQGIYPLLFDQDRGTLCAAGDAANLDNPTYLAYDQTRSLVFAVSETEQSNGLPGGSLAVFRLAAATAALPESPAASPDLPDARSARSDQSGAGSAAILEPIDRQLIGGSSPCHLLLDPPRRLAAVANYSSGSATIVSYQPDGCLDPAGRPEDRLIRHQGSGPDRSRQEQAHVHHVSLTPDGTCLNLVDLGLDQIVAYAWPIEPSAASAVRPVARLNCPPGAGPRHLLYAAGGERIYAVMEMGSEVVSFARSATGMALYQRISTLPADCRTDNTCAAIRLTPDGRWLLASNRGHDSLAVFAVDQTDGRLTWLGCADCRGRNPRDFCLLPKPGGADWWVLAASQDDDRISTYVLDGRTGQMTGPQAVYAVPAPVCLLPVMTWRS